jgi:hypothetical protein
MNSQPTQSCSNIGLWLVIATDGLYSSAKSRIESEIQNHYNEAVESHLGAGSSNEEAKARALTELGDPKIAAKNFRRRHLTKKEVQSITKVIFVATNPSSRKALFFTGFLFLISVSLMALFDTYRECLKWTGFFLLFMLGEFICGVSVRFAKELPQPQLTRRVLLITGLHDLFSLFYFVIFYYFIPDPIVALALAPSMVSIFDRHGIILWFKVRNKLHEEQISYDLAGSSGTSAG